MAPRQNTPSPLVVRSSAGLRDAIFDEIDALRSGTSNATRANAVAKLAATVVETVRMEIDVQKYAAQASAQVEVVGASRGLPQSLQLGAA
jgi:hypothetical protein